MIPTSSSPKWKPTRTASFRRCTSRRGHVHRVRRAVGIARVRHARRIDIATLGRSCSETLDHGKVSFGTEASLFHNAAIPAIICGLGHIAQAHQPNEWVAVDQLRRCEAFMQRLVDRVTLA
jgi:hypothetical protein